MDHLKYLLVALVIGLLPSNAWSQQATTATDLTWWNEFVRSVTESEGQALLLVFAVLVCLFVGCILKNPEIH
ncbi:hypothetical protein [Thalassotalea fusca]